MGEQRRETFIDSFLRMTGIYPNNKAVTDSDGFWTFAELESLSNLFADEILHTIYGNTSREKNIGSFYIPLILPRKKAALATSLGVMRSGNAYVFLSPKSPPDRLHYMLSDLSAPCVITTGEIATRYGLSKNYRVLLVEDVLGKWEKGTLPQEQYNRTDYFAPAFITYTSGSTGMPKGAVDTFAYLANHIDTRFHFYQPGPDECIGGVVSFEFGASTYDLFPGLTVGCNVYLLSDDELMNQSMLTRKIIEHNITTLFMIPSMLKLIFVPGAELPIRCVITAGEKMRSRPKTDAMIVEIFGSSEAAAELGRVVTDEDTWDLIGKAVPGTTLYLMDSEGKQITTPGVEGELCVVNDAVSLGYLNRPEETEKKFVPCPFGPQAEGEAPRRMYRTGDMMRFDEEGNFYLCGRRDNMVKINGQRAEMGEIEHVVCLHPGIRDAICKVFEKNQSQMLVCYYLKEDPEKEISGEELFAHTVERLPRYMIPRFWVAMDEFPKTVNGKTDRVHLPEPDYSKNIQNVQPENYMEELMLEAARGLLPDIPFGVTDDLLRLGLDSIRAVQFAGEIEKADARITVSDVLRYRSIRKTLNSPKEIAWLYEGYQPEKPVVVLLHGIIPVSGYTQLCDTCRQFFNVYLIEPLTDHIKELMDEPDYDELVSCYMDQLMSDLPEDAEIWGFIGYSFGGQLAISMADRYRKETGKTTQVIMGDTWMQVFAPGRTFPHLKKDDRQIIEIHERTQKYGKSPVNEPVEVTLVKQNMVADLLNTIHENTRYDGPVLYLDAKSDYDAAGEQAKVSVVKALYPNLQIMEFPEFSHNDLYLSAEMSAFYRSYFNMKTKRTEH